jgi:hypothetical protein
MSAINENLILNVFAGMVKNKPSLSKYIPEKDEEIDYRIIVDLVIQSSQMQFVSLNFEN